jgi:hypothetical protein
MSVRRWFSFGLLLILTVICWRAYRLHEIRSGFAQVQLSDSKQQVIKKMGRPKRIEKCGAYFATAMPGCVDEYVYADQWAPALPEYWILSFGSNGTVIGSNRLASP